MLCYLNPCIVNDYDCSYYKIYTKHEHRYTLKIISYMAVFPVL